MEAHMSNEATATVIGNLTADPELRFTAVGRPVAHFTVASTTRAFDSTSGLWRDGDTLFLRCTAWLRLAEHVIESLRNGNRVVVTGRLQQHTLDAEEGEKRSTLELVADDVGVSLRHLMAKPMPSRRSEDMRQDSSTATGKHRPLAGDHSETVQISDIPASSGIRHEQ
jgi:single-strand DNA-binding protein